MINSIYWGNGKIVSGSQDCTIRVWNLETGECLRTLAGHTGSVNCLDLLDNIIVSGSSDSTVRVWDLHTGQLIYTLKDQIADDSDNDICCLQVVPSYNHVVSGGFDGNIRVWDYSSGKLVDKLTGHTDWVYCLLVAEPYQLQPKSPINDPSSQEKQVAYSIISGSWDTTVKIWERMVHNDRRRNRKSKKLSKMFTTTQRVKKLK